MMLMMMTKYTNSMQKNFKMSNCIFVDDVFQTRK